MQFFEPALLPIASQLRWLGYRRLSIRLAIGFVSLVAVLAMIIATLFVIDYWLQPGRFLRVLLLLIATVLSVRLMRRFVWPWLTTREGLIDLALLSDRNLGLNGNLVAALQFGMTQEPIGSAKLRSAVVRSVTAESDQLPIKTQFKWQPFPQRLAVAFVLLGILLAAAGLFPQEWGIFGRRLLLKNVAYPTQTQVAAVSINRQATWSSVDSNKTATQSFPVHSTLRFEVQAVGELPQAGEIAFITPDGRESSLVLKAQPGSWGTYTAQLDQFAEPVVPEVRLGDSRILLPQLTPILPPVVTLVLEGHPPQYAAGEIRSPLRGTYTLTVPEGSSVDVGVQLVRGRLKTAAILVGETQVALVPNQDRTFWSLPREFPLFDDVGESVAFEVKVGDLQGMGTADPVRGSIRVREDRPPRVAAAAAVRRVLPTAQPQLRYAASDDYGLQKLSLIMEHTRPGEQPSVYRRPLDLRQGSPRIQEDAVQLDLSEFPLKFGDTLMASLEATDERGDRPGVAEQSEPVRFEVTDRNGLLASLLEADEEGAERLDAIIRRQLGMEER